MSTYFVFNSPTKACIIASIIFIVDRKTDWISVPHALVYFGIVIFFVYFKLSSLLLGIHDPFIPFENLFSAIFFGGIWDALAHIIANGKYTPHNKLEIMIFPHLGNDFTLTLIASATNS